MSKSKGNILYKQFQILHIYNPLKPVKAVHYLYVNVSLLLDRMNHYNSSHFSWLIHNSLSQGSITHL